MTTFLTIVVILHLLTDLILGYPVKDMKDIKMGLTPEIKPTISTPVQQANFVQPLKLINATLADPRTQANLTDEDWLQIIEGIVGIVLGIVFRKKG